MLGACESEVNCTNTIYMYHIRLESTTAASRPAVACHKQGARLASPGGCSQEQISYASNACEPDTVSHGIRYLARLLKVDENGVFEEPSRPRILLRAVNAPVLACSVISKMMMMMNLHLFQPHQADQMFDPSWVHLRKHTLISV